MGPREEPSCQFWKLSPVRAALLSALEPSRVHALRIHSAFSQATRSLTTVDVGVGVLCRPGHVLAAHERLAIDKLLITDALFRCSDVKTRAKWVAVVESVRDAQGTVHIFSSMHVSGEQLQNLSGVAAVLRFPLPDIEDMEL